MPAQQQQYAPFLQPQRPGEQVPDSQIVTSGPFSAELSQPQFRPPQVKETGYGGTSHALLSFANNFLAGASQGRLRQFQQSEKTKQEHERAFDSVVQHIQDDPTYTKEFKRQVFEGALRTKASAATAAMGKGKGGKNEHPLLQTARGIFNGIIGPSENIQHVDIGPDHVAELINQMHDPANKFNMAEAVSDAQAKLAPVFQKIQSVAGSPGTEAPPPVDGSEEAGFSNMPTRPNIPVYRGDVIGHRDVTQALKGLTDERIDPMSVPGIRAMFEQFPERLLPTQIAQMERLHAGTAASHSTQSLRAVEQAYAIAKANAPLPPVTFDKNGKRFGAEKHQDDNRYYHIGTKIPIPEEDMVGATVVDKTVQAAEIRAEIARQALEHAEYILTHKQEFPEDQVTDAEAYMKLARPVRPRSPREQSPGQIQKEKTNKIVGALRLKHGSNKDPVAGLAAAMAELRTTLADDPAQFAVAEKQLAAAFPKTKPKKLSIAEQYAEARKAKEAAGTTASPQPAQQPTAAPPVIVTPATPVAPKVGDPIMFNGQPMMNRRTGKPYLVGDAVTVGGQPTKIIGVNAKGEALVE